MSPDSQNNFFRYVLISVIILLVGIAILLLARPIIGNVFSNINASLPFDITPLPNTPTPASPGNLKNVDQILNQALTASIAYNAPEKMQLEDTAIIQLLLNPSISEEELSQQVEESGAVTTGTVQVTPLMKAELKAQNGEAFVIEPLHDTPEQPVSTTDTTRWQWQVTAKKGGAQGLTLVVYRLIRYENKDYWREVETYKADIIVEVTLTQRLQAFDWKWLGGLLLTSLIIPIFLRWWDKRKPATKPAKKRSD